MEKATSLIEADENLDTIDGDEDSIGSDGQTKSAIGRAGHSGVERTLTGRGQLDGQLEETHIDPALRRGSTSPTLPRSFKPIESGVFSGVTSPASGGQVALSLQNALSSASRGEAELASLHRSVRDASRALTASRHAHESLTEDLRMMHRGLSEVMSEKAAVERYAALLTQERDAALDAAEEARREAKREREFLLREQDRFIQLLLEEHEAELQQLRHALGLRAQSQVSPSGINLVRSSEATLDTGPVTSPGLAPPPMAPIGVAIDRASGAPFAPERFRAIPLPDAAERGAFDKGPLETQRSEVLPILEKPILEKKEEERPPTYPPAPAVLDLDSLAHEVDGNSERPPPIRRIGVNEPKLHLRPARVPTQLLDTLVSKLGDEPNRKS